MTGNQRELHLVGRYAPTPSGALHLGNLRTAVAAWCSARARGGRFLLRVEDLDRQRCRPEWVERQLHDLRTLGIDWDAEPVHQSRRDGVYQEAFDTLLRRRLVYPCFCSRREIREALSAPHGPVGSAYPGTCAALGPSEAGARIAAGRQHCWRLRVGQAPKIFFDGFAGEAALDLEREGGDFVIRRADGLFGYQMACAVDDGLSGVTEVLRGDDLLDSGARQAYLLACLGLPAPRYAHIPLVRKEGGERLAKRQGSEDLSGYRNRGLDTAAVLSWIAWSLGLAERGERIDAPSLLPGRWDRRRIPREAFVLRDDDLAAFSR